MLKLKALTGSKANENVKMIISHHIMQLYPIFGPNLVQLQQPDEFVVPSIKSMKTF